MIHTLCFCINYDTEQKSNPYNDALYIKNEVIFFREITSLSSFSFYSLLVSDDEVLQFNLYLIF